VLRRAPCHGLVGGGLEGGLLLGRHVVPYALGDRQKVEADEVRGQHDLRHDLVELHVLDVGQRVVLAVDRAGLEAGIDLGIGHGGRIGAERLAEELPGFAGRHAQLDAGHVGGRVDLLVARFRPTWRVPK
jgi:hypothetical protein